MAFPGRSTASPDFNLYVTRFDPDAQAGRGQFFPPDSQGTSLSKLVHDGTSGGIRAGDDRAICLAADGQNTLWLVWPSSPASTGPGIYATHAP